MNYFSEKVENRKLCQSKLNNKDFEMLREAIEEHYYFEFVIDDIPIRNFLGYLEETNLFPHKHNMYLYTHYHFDFFINNNQVEIQSINRKRFSSIYLDNLCEYFHKESSTNVFKQ